MSYRYFEFAVEWIDGLDVAQDLFEERDEVRGGDYAWDLAKERAGEVLAPLDQLDGWTLPVTFDAADVAPLCREVLRRVGAAPCEVLFERGALELEGPVGSVVVSLGALPELVTGGLSRSGEALSGPQPRALDAAELDSERALPGAQSRALDAAALRQAPPARVLARIRWLAGFAAALDQLAGDDARVALVTPSASDPSLSLAAGPRDALDAAELGGLLVAIVGVTPTIVSRAR